MKKYVGLFILSTLVFTASGCGKSGGFRVDDIPTEIAKPDDLREDPADDVLTEVPAEPDPSDAETIVDAQAQLDSETPQAQEPQPGLAPAINQTGKKSLWNTVIEKAKWVIQYEKAKVGNSCNFFVQRVFEKLGIGRGSWVANTFDSYVKSEFASYQFRTFNDPSVAVNRQHLHEYLWSQPEGTGFVFQWKRRSGHGHIAIVQRVQNTLVIYHASLNKFGPRAQRSNMETLLSPKGDNNNLNVFSNLLNGNE